MSALGSSIKKDLPCMMLSKLYTSTLTLPRRSARVWWAFASTRMFIPTLQRSLHPSQRLRGHHLAARHRSRSSISAIHMWTSSTSLDPAMNAPSPSVADHGQTSMHREIQNTHVDHLETQNVTRHKYFRRACMLLSQTSIRSSPFTRAMWWHTISGWLTRPKL